MLMFICISQHLSKTNMSETHTAAAAAAEHRGNPSNGELSDIARELLGSGEVMALPPDQQGKFILDRWLGALTKMSENSPFYRDKEDRPLTPAQTVARIQRAINGKRTHAEVVTGIEATTRTAGLRSSLVDLLNDQRTGPLLLNAGEFPADVVKQNSRGETVLGSIAAVEGYVLAAAPGYTSWKAPIIEQVRHTAYSPAHYPTPVWDDWEVRGTDIPAVKHATAPVLAEADRLRQSGALDLDLVSRSMMDIHAQKLQDNQQQGIHRAMVEMQAPIIGIPQQTFDHMFR